MPQAVTHIVVALIVASIFRDYYVKDKRTFPIKYVLIAGIAGLLPDIDVVAYWILHWFGYSLEIVHRTFMHSIFIPLIFLFAAIIISRKARIRVDDKLLKWKYIFLMIFLGVTIHLILDAGLAGQIMPFYPFSNFTIGNNIADKLPTPLDGLFFPCLDAGLLVIWLVYLEKKHHISRFI